MIRWFQKTKYYNNLEIPAKLFFEILADEDVNKLIITGKPKQKELEATWDNLVDLFFKETNNPEMAKILSLQVNIRWLIHAIQAYKIYLEILYSNPFTNRQLLDIIKNLRSIGLKVNTSKSLNSEIQRLLRVSIGSLEFKLKIAIKELKDLTKGEKTTFYDALANMYQDGGVPINENITLGFYISYQKKLSKK